MVHQPVAGGVRLISFAPLAKTLKNQAVDVVHISGAKVPSI
jgi:hypothetical protein